jgi:hypothetical protein
VKRSEVIRRLGPAMDEAVKGSLYVAGALHINEAALSAIATALGIEVEPDEEPLPERLEPAGFPWPASWPASRDVAIPEEGWWFASVTKPGGGWEALIASPHKGLADALISAYNERPRWRTGVPERDGEYIVMGPISTEVVTRLSGWWPSWATGRPWMPLPAAPK